MYNLKTQYIIISFLQKARLLLEKLFQRAKFFSHLKTFFLQNKLFAF